VRKDYSKDVVWRRMLDLQDVNHSHERAKALADISRSRYVVTATQTAHRLQIRPTVHN